MISLLVHRTFAWRFVLATFLLSVGAALAADAPASKPADTEAQKDGNKIITDATAFYQALQLKPDAAIPNWVVAGAKGLILIDRWSGAAGIGATGGSGIGFKKNASGKFSAPAFYALGGVSLGLQLGGSHTQTAAFLMSDKALVTLTDSKFVWSGNVRAIAGPHSASDTTLDDKVDVLFYQFISGLDAGATVAGTQLSVDYITNRKFYNSPNLTPEDIFLGKVVVPESAKTLINALDEQASKSTVVPSKR